MKTSGISHTLTTPTFITPTFPNLRRPRRRRLSLPSILSPLALLWRALRLLHVQMLFRRIFLPTFRANLQFL